MVPGLNFSGTACMTSASVHACGGGGGGGGGGNVFPRVDLDEPVVACRTTSDAFPFILFPELLYCLMSALLLLHRSSVLALTWQGVGQ